MDDHHFGYKQKFLKKKHTDSVRDSGFFGGEFWHSSKKKNHYKKIHCKA
jgi:hypothetical protein